MVPARTRPPLPTGSPVTRPFVKIVSMLSIGLGLLPVSVHAFQAVADDDQEVAETYTDVITDEAETDAGLFDVHRVGETFFFEIPDSLLGRDMLLVSRIGKVPVGFPGFQPAGVKTGEQVLRWERRGDRVLLRSISYANVAPDSLAIAISVEANNFAPIIGAFDIEVAGEDGSSSVIDVTSFYQSDTPALTGLSASLRSEYEVRGLDADRSFINYARSFPLNVDVRHTMTYNAADPPAQARSGTISMEMHQSMILLPEEPLRPRFADSRVGWFSITRTNFGLDEQKAADETFIRRWRLEPSDPERYFRGELVDPVKPIVYYIDPGTPEKWRPYVKMGVEDWQAAFETAGFSNAIVAMDPPSAEEAPEWSAQDVRYSVVRWAANTTRNAQGPSVSDPRTGEIIESDIVWYHNHMRSYRNRLMIETGAANPEARSLDIPEELMGETMRQVIAHEVGHALGLPHNWVASSAFPVDSLRSPTFTAAYGVAASIMEYARQNYIAQPGDGVTRFVRMIGPYDHYAINWGYRVMPGVETPEAEKPILDQWIMDRAGDPMYRFGPVGPNYSPAIQTEDLGDDPVRASQFGIANLKRVLPNLPAWTATAGEDYGDLAELYGELVGMWNRYTGHVVTMVGGVYMTPKATDEAGAVYAPVSGDDQRRAVRFLNEQVFDGVDWLNDSEVLYRTEGTGAVARIQQLQARALNNLLDPERMVRVTEAGLVDEGAYPLMELFDDLREGIWSELDGDEAIGAYRRSLQRVYLERMAVLMTHAEPGEGVGEVLEEDEVETLMRSDVRPLARGQLEAIQEAAEDAAPADAMTRYHLADVVARIDAILAG
ncbi:MAG: zinc-dependent metalloprotease [Gemmatimonadetes bacterium]|nr:zinc-dependent metalloprotease [Gemmatimonadota bacterium]